MFVNFINRPVLSLVISIFIVLFGLLAVFTLPIRTVDSAEAWILWANCQIILNQLG